MSRAKKNRSKIFLTTSFAFLACLVFCYVFQVSQMAQAGYEIGQNQSRLENSKKEVAGLEASLLKNSTLDKYEQKLNELGYQKIDRIDYVAVSSAIVARNK
jgi:cell division protein FtsL